MFRAEKGLKTNCCVVLLLCPEHRFRIPSVDSDPTKSLTDTDGRNLSSNQTLAFSQWGRGHVLPLPHSGSEGFDFSLTFTVLFVVRDPDSVTDRYPASRSRSESAASGIHHRLRRVGAVLRREPQRNTMESGVCLSRVFHHKSHHRR